MGTHSEERGMPRRSASVDPAQNRASLRIKPQFKGIIESRALCRFL
jgi:hypothetical protein